ncbi:MAG: substrate-binding domain-containing protein, partial [Chloroflexota bacterium]
IANEQQAYTLADRATYLARQTEGLDLTVLVEGDETLFNPYGVIPVNPEVHPTVNAELAQAFVDWLIASETQELIETFVVNDTQLFYANADASEEPVDDEMMATEEAGS